MNAIGIITILLLALIIIPVPLVWIISSIFPDGNMQKHADRIRRALSIEWKRILAGVIFVALLFVFAREYAWQVTLIGVAILIGRAVALSRNK